MTDVLLVGAGAVGSVLGFHLAKGGAKVTYLVRPAHLPDLADGLKMYPVNRRDPFREPVVFREFATATSTAEIAGRHWDFVVLCMSSTALRRGTWLDELVPAVGDAAFAAIQPGVDDYAWVKARVPAERIVWGMFGLMAWAADAEHDHAPTSGTAFWRPPFASLPWSGPRAAAFAAALKAGGLPSHTIPDVQRELAFMGPLLEVHTVALECVGYDFAALRADRALMADAHAALHDATALAVKAHGGRAPFVFALVRPWVSRLLLWLAPKVVTFDIEAFFQRHYTKVSDQTVEVLAEKIALAKKLGVPSPGIERLMARLQARRAA